MLNFLIIICSDGLDYNKNLWELFPYRCLDVISECMIFVFIMFSRDLMIMTVDTTNINLSYCMISNEIKANLDTCYIQSASFIFNVYKCNLPVLN